MVPPSGTTATKFNGACEAATRKVSARKGTPHALARKERVVARTIATVLRADARYKEDEPCVLERLPLQVQKHTPRWRHDRAARTGNSTTFTIELRSKEEPLGIANSLRHDV
jgi:hypothetical protein